MKILITLKEFVKNLLIIYGAVTVCLLAFFHFISPWWRVRIYDVLQLFYMVSIIALLRLFTERFDFKYAVLEILLEFGLVTMVGVAGWWFFGWTAYVPFPFVILISAVTYAIVWFALTVKTSQDIAYINKQIRRRADKRKIGRDITGSDDADDSFDLSK